MNDLHVWWRRNCVGLLQVDRDDRMTFCYDAQWLASADAFPISLSLPLRSEPHRDTAHQFFANLLPEADVRARLCQRLKVTPTTLWKIDGGGTILVVERYDRRRENNTIYRLYQEDFCQALGRSPLRKYQKEGGPRPGDVAEILRRHGSLPSEDLRLLVRWGLFNWLFGNGDAHAKNISLIFDPAGGIRLAPFYDLVCTRVYKSLDHHLAMSLGAQFDPGAVLQRDLEAYARELQVSPRMVRENVAELLETGTQRLEEAIAEFHTRHGNAPILEMVRLQVARNLKRATTLLR